MSKQLVDRKEQGGMIARMNGLVIGISDTSYTVSSQSGSRNLGDLERDMKTLSNSKLGVSMKRGLKTGNITTCFATDFMKER